MSKICLLTGIDGETTLKKMCINCIHSKYIDETDKYTGKVKIETIDIDTSPKEVVKISVKFKGNGALTFPTQAE